MKEKKIRRKQNKGVWMERKGGKMRERNKPKKKSRLQCFFFFLLQSPVSEVEPQRELPIGKEKAKNKK